MFRIGKPLLLASLFFITTGLFAAEKNYKETFKLNNGGELRVRLDVGSLDIQTWDRQEVAFEASVRGSNKFINEFEFDFQSSHDRVEILGERPNRKWGWSNGGQKVKVTLRVPKQVVLDVKTAGGNIKVQDVIGSVELRTSGGNIHLGSIRGNTQVATSGGDIYLEDLHGDLDARTSGGNIELESVTGEVLAKTSGGNIRLSINSPYKGVRASTSGGHIRCYVEGELNANLYARTSGGSVEVDFPVTIQGRVSRTKIEGKINQGGPEMNLRSSGGNIKILQAK